ncbi:AraC family transcriptional regulator [Roseospira marina]|uniref:AraC family transcriptional regulator n=2 Tax=Roseospira marina TaxID=140057 RepID=A0A5M6I9H6_9PROT|nr:AraC family transcriptional regulator [Roseospira marina]
MRLDVTLAQGAGGHSPHRHDTYAVGLTRAGVQAFSYRGIGRHTCVGQAYVLHPDVRHDGRPGTEGGFGYSTLYVPPALIAACLGGRSLPFLSDPVAAAGPLRDTIWAVLAATGDAVDPLVSTDVVVMLADALADAAGARPNRSVGAIDGPALARVRALLCETLEAGITAPDLERVSGLDRWTLYRQFRAVHGVSPGRYRTARRLDAVRAAIRAGAGLADAAAQAGFSDQSHMTRQFRAAYGLAPGQWRALADTESSGTLDGGAHGS